MRERFIIYWMEVQKKFFECYEFNCLFFRRNSFRNTTEQNYLPSVDTLVHESTKENRDILNFCHSNEDSVYDTIEDDEGYLKSFDLRRNSSLRYSKAPTAHVPSKEEDENINNGYLDVLK